MVGSYSSTKWLWINWIVNADLPTPSRQSRGMEKKGRRKEYLHLRRRQACIRVKIAPITCQLRAAELEGIWQRTLAPCCAILRPCL